MAATSSFTSAATLGLPMKIKPAALLLLLLLLLPLHLAATAARGDLYDAHCGRTIAAVPDSDTSPCAGSIIPPFRPSTHLGFYNNALFFLFLGDRVSDRYASRLLPATFNRLFACPTSVPAVFHLAGTLDLNVSVFRRREGPVLSLEGFWSADDGELCMVGVGVDEDRSSNRSSPVDVGLTAVFKLQYPKRTNITTSFLRGSLQLLNHPAEITSARADGLPVPLVVYGHNDYEYTQLDRAKRGCGWHDVGSGSNAMLPVMGTAFSCSDLLRALTVKFKLEHPSGSGGGAIGIHESFMNFDSIKCDEDGKMRMLIWFTNQSFTPRRRGHSLTPSTAVLLAEGSWDYNQSRLCMAACRVLVSGVPTADLSVDAADCPFQMTFWFMAELSIQSRSSIVGAISDERTATGSMASSTILARTQRMWHDGTNLSGQQRYVYTRVEEARQYCSKNNTITNNRNRYPDSTSPQDFSFFFSSAAGSAFAYPVSIGSSLCDPRGWGCSGSANYSDRIFNISYQIEYSLLSSSGFVQDTEISAEGVYNARTGELCMVGCRRMNGSSEDCMVRINAQFAPMEQRSKKGHVTGRISSLRDAGDPLFFKPTEIVSNGLYYLEAAQSISAMKMERIMMLVSLSFSCVFSVLQLRHVAKNPQLVPFMSVTMLAMLSLGTVVPLARGLTAILASVSGGVTMLQWIDGERAEATEILMSAAAFLLTLRVNRVAWAGRRASNTAASLWSAEKRALFTCAPLFIAGGSMHLIVHLLSSDETATATVFEGTVPLAAVYTWISGAADGFMLPQLAFNVFSELEPEKIVLSPAFLFGAATVLVLPYAVGNILVIPFFFPTSGPGKQIQLHMVAWSAIMACLAYTVVLAVYLQQMLGGDFLLRVVKLRRLNQRHEIVLAEENKP